MFFLLAFLHFYVCYSIRYDSEGNLEGRCMYGVSEGVSTKYWNFHDNKFRIWVRLAILKFLRHDFFVNLFVAFRDDCDEVENWGKKERFLRVWFFFLKECCALELPDLSQTNFDLNHLKFHKIYCIHSGIKLFITFSPAALL